MLSPLNPRKDHVRLPAVISVSATLRSAKNDCWLKGADFISCDTHDLHNKLRKRSFAHCKTKFCLEPKFGLMYQTHQADWRCRVNRTPQTYHVQPSYFSHTATLQTHGQFLADIDLAKAAMVFASKLCGCPKSGVCVRVENNLAHMGSGKSGLSCPGTDQLPRTI